MSILLNEILRLKRLNDTDRDDEMLDDESLDLDGEEDLDSDDDLDTGDGEIDGEEDDDFSEFDDLVPDDEDDLDGEDELDDEFVDDEGDDEEDRIRFDDETDDREFEDDEFTELEDAPKEPGGDIGQQQQQPQTDDQLQFDDGETDETDNQVDEEPDDPNRAGVIRAVKGAHLVYKREQEDGTYEEMWIYNSGKFKKDLEVKKAILAGTDIPKNSHQSPDGEQQVKMWSAGNADIVIITGLPQ